MPNPYILQNVPGNVSFSQNPALSQCCQLPQCEIPFCAHNPVQFQLITLIFSSKIWQGDMCGLLLLSQSDLQAKDAACLCSPQYSWSEIRDITWAKLLKTSVEVLLAWGLGNGLHLFIKLSSPLAYRELLCASIKLWLWGNTTVR